jgi:hypothetical protein
MVILYKARRRRGEAAIVPTRAPATTGGFPSCTCSCVGVRVCAARTSIGEEGIYKRARGVGEAVWR